MTEHDVPDRDLMASAIVDGTADADTLALVARDPQLAARVEEFRHVRALLAASEPVDAERRDRAVSAALAAWGADHEDAPAVPPPARSVGRQRWWLGVAAAAVAAAALGVVLSNADLGSDTDETSDAVIESAATVMADTGEAEQSTEQATGTDDLMIAGAPATDTAPESAAGPAEEATDVAGTAPDVVGPDALVALAEAARSAPTSIDTACDVTGLEVVTVTRYAATPDTAAVDVLVAIDDTAGTVVALDAVTCQPVATVPTG